MPCSIEFKSIVPILGSGMTASFISTIHGEILCHEDMIEETAGFIILTHMNIWTAGRMGISTGEVFKDHKLYGNEILQNGKLKHDIGKVIHGLNVLIIDTVELLPRWRGQGLALKAIKTAIQNYGQDCMYVLLTPIPTQAKVHENSWKAKLLLSQYSRTDVAAATLKLTGHFKSIGFQPTEPDSPVMFLAPIILEP